jgi:hypothetical protein
VDSGATKKIQAGNLLAGKQAHSVDLDAISAFGGSFGILVRTSGGGWALRQVTSLTTGFAITNPAGDAGNVGLNIIGVLGSLNGIGGTGFPVVTATGLAGTVSPRQMAAGSSKLSLLNPDGVAGSPTYDVVEANLHVANMADYSTGSWTPNIGGTGGQSGQTYSIQEGTYVKVGRDVSAYFTMSLSALGTITGGVQVQGLPFLSQSTGNYRATAITFWNAMTTSIVIMLGRLIQNTTAVDIRIATGATTGLATSAVQADLSATTTIAGSIIYRSDS